MEGKFKTEVRWGYQYLSTGRLIAHRDMIGVVTGRVRKFLQDNRLTIEDGKLIGSAATTFDLIDIQFIKYMVEKCSNPNDAWNPIDWDAVEESWKDHWHNLMGRIRNGSALEQARFDGGNFCVRDPAHGPVDMNHNLFLMEFTPELLDDLIAELGRTGGDGIIPVQGFGA